MNSRHLLPIALGILLTSQIIWAEVPLGPSSPEGAPPMESPAASQAKQDTTQPSAETPWASVVVTNGSEINNKLTYYKKKGYYPKTIGNGKLVALFTSMLPQGLVEELKYAKYPVNKDYLIHLGVGTVYVKQEPRFASANAGRLGYGQHIATDGIVIGEYSERATTDQWYRVKWGDPAAPKVGYVYAPWITKRDFQFEKMHRSINLLKGATEGKRVAHIDNYKNRSGYAPKHNGQGVDDYGVIRDQAAAAYFTDVPGADFRYLTDGSIVIILSETTDFFQVSTADSEGVFYVEKKYVRTEPVFTGLEKVVIVDRNNQNEAVFERNGEGWKLVSYLFATTGEKAKFKQETSLGSFMVMERRSRFEFLGDISKVVEGYAPYAIRFNGGAYIHGVPVGYRDVKQTKIIKPAVLDAMGKVVVPAVTKEIVVSRKDPGIAEYLSSIGTIPKSHKCVRNYSSHAKFLYEWTEIGKTAVIVIE